MTPRGRQDRRIEKTQRLLHEALGALILEKSYDSISVKEILDRANIGRSTFYMHFHDKDELLAASVHNLLRPLRLKERPDPLGPHEGLIWFSRPLFEHIHMHRRMGRAKIGARGRAILHEHLRRVLVEMIAEEVRETSQRSPKAANKLSPDLIVQYVASTFILVLNWWTESRSRLSPREADDVFKAMVLPTLITIG